MKSLIVLFVFGASVSSGAFSQKKTNGTVYIDHPAIKVVDDFVKATVSGDTSKIANFLSEDFT